MKGYNKLRREALQLLETQLPEELYFHSIHHTKNLLKISRTYLRSENVSGHEAKLVKAAILLHDVGFTVSGTEHEQTSKRIAGELMKKYGFAPRDIKTVQNLILATRIPQSPRTKLERIICDCDLDYLGRKDFYSISDKLFRELQVTGKVATKLEWDKIQVAFLEKHQYHTNFGLRNREPRKQKHLAELKRSLRQQPAE